LGKDRPRTEKTLRGGKIPPFPTKKRARIKKGLSREKEFLHKKQRGGGFGE